MIGGVNQSEISVDSLFAVGAVNQVAWCPAIVGGPRTPGLDPCQARAWACSALAGGAPATGSIGCIDDRIQPSTHPRNPAARCAQPDRPGRSPAPARARAREVGGVAVRAR